MFGLGVEADRLSIVWKVSDNSHNEKILPQMSAHKMLGHRNETDYHTFNELENTRISELTTATNIFNYPVTKNLIYLRDKVQIYRMTRVRVEDLIRDTIKFCKSLVSFTNTCPEDQLSLLKNGCMNLLCMRFLAYYNVDKTMYYLNLLTAIRYLLLKYRSKSESQLKLKRLMELLIEFNTISNMRRAVHSKQMMESLQYCGPLMRERLLANRSTAYCQHLWVIWVRPDRPSDRVVGEDHHRVLSRWYLHIDVVRVISQWTSVRGVQINVLDVRNLQLTSPDMFK
ncbi:unnamed protein product [Oppiella nova]|uniref:Uncharacterized protein n=1 Tax=Oppiella nova TaxID=334625 RepID=A0A7R9LM24_9ACAR|nr:unnamed protein product [Oppiella nova]CAG2164887.1 unnamed protein product [Oppiella nova]